MTLEDKIRAHVKSLSPESKKAIRASMTASLRDAACTDFSTRIDEAIEMASKAGLSDEEIIEYARRALQKLIHRKRAVIFNRHGSS